MPYIIRRNTKDRPAKPDTPTKVRKDRDWDWLLCSGDLAILAIPFVLACTLLDISVIAGDRLRIVPKGLYPLIRGLGVGSRVITALSLVVFTIAVFHLVLFLAVLIYCQECLWPAWTLLISIPTALFSAAFTHASRCATAEIDAVKPISNETANALPQTETLLRASSASAAARSAEMLRPAAQSTRRDDPRELMHVAGR